MAYSNYDVTLNHLKYSMHFVRLFVIFSLSFSVVTAKANVITSYYADGITVRSLEQLPTETTIGVSLHFAKNGSLESAKSFNFKNTILNQTTFFVDVALSVQSIELRIIDFALANKPFQQIYKRFLADKIQKENNVINKSHATIQTITPSNQSTKVSTNVSSHLLAPLVDKPKVASGLKFLPNGRNKLYTKTGDIWMDGEFKKGQLMDGKVFLYDADGVLLKVRIYKNGAYERDGLL